MSPVRLHVQFGDTDVASIARAFGNVCGFLGELFQ